MDGAVSTSLALGGLDEPVGAFENAVGDLALEPTEHAIPMTFDGLRDLDDGRQAPVGSPEIPFLEEGFGLVGRLIVELLEGRADLIRPRGPEVGSGQTIDFSALRGRQVCGVLEPQVTLIEDIFESLGQDLRHNLMSVRRVMEIGREIQKR